MADVVSEGRRLLADYRRFFDDADQDALGSFFYRNGDALLDCADAQAELVNAADWYRRCLEDVVDRRPVRGLAEAKAVYDSAVDAARAAARLEGETP